MKAKEFCKILMHSVQENNRIQYILQNFKPKRNILFAIFGAEKQQISFRTYHKKSSAGKQHKSASTRKQQNSVCNCINQYLCVA